MGSPYVGQVGWMNPITGQDGSLTIDHIHSEGFITGVQGWEIRKDGSAEFNDVLLRGELNVVNGNSSILIQNDIYGGFPGIFLQPDATLYNAGVLGASAGVDPDTATLQLSSPSDLSAPGASSADLFLRSGYTGKNSQATFDVDVLEAFGGFIFEGAAKTASVTANSGAVVPGGNLDVVTTTIAALAGCTYEIKGVWHGVGFVTPVAFPGNLLTMRLTRNGTQIASKRILGQNSALTQEGGAISIPDTPGAGNFTYALSILHEAGSTAASVHTVATANSPSNVSVRGFSANI